MATNEPFFELNTYIKYLRSASLFRGIPEDKYQNVLNCLQARVEYYPARTSLVNAGDKDFRAGVLLEGGLEEFIYDENGNPVVISHLKSGSVFGAELACGSSLASQFYLDASVDSRVLLLDFQILLNPSTLTCPYRMQVTANLLQELANQITFFNTKVRILSQKKLRDKIKVYLQTQEISEDGTIRLPFSRSKLAEFLYVDRSALSRELCRMRDEGVLTFSGSKITMLDYYFLAG
ncbi:Crp/Fnr family transcriptional regulator [Roseburia sp. MSJ-14]|uniref:Crp/Fnr family transcriptional regulator n=1 Tax=Roseburia sp. MSJ-14 TaxID=2841514 RepID=UPI001C112611|nr:Crp/Fnr family transcriptional regulator [Roseburia sp. MSJ-14]MBU5474821.1 Crp/Fnr family transcriptional regulator [Roseburia sp. MSJ-14]